MHALGRSLVQWDIVLASSQLAICCRKPLKRPESGEPLTLLCVAAQHEKPPPTVVRKMWAKIALPPQHRVLACRIANEVPREFFLVPAVDASDAGCRKMIGQEDSAPFDIIFVDADKKK